MPSNTVTTAVTWSSSNTSIATVDTLGNVTAKAAGTATITATTKSNGYTATKDIVIIIPVTSVAVNKSTMLLKVGAADVGLNATIAPLNATIDDLTWTSSYSAFATVSSTGVVHAVAPGSVVITAASTQDSTKKVTSTITVISGLSVISTLSTANMGGTKAVVSTKLLPSNTATTDVTWSSSATNIATVDTLGNVTPVAVGTTTITATTKSNGYTATKDIVIIIPVTSVAINKSAMLLKVGAADVGLTATIAPVNATIPGLTWTSSAPTIATVNSSGVVHAVASGSTVITATSVQDATKKITSTISVISGLSLTSTLTTPVLGGTKAKVTAKVLPSNVPITAVTWSSSDTNIATIDTLGNVTAVAKGPVTITATTNDNSYTATILITII